MALYAHIGNFGVSILILTVIVKALFFPLANKSYAAMSKMKALQPEMEKMTARYGEDRQRLNQEMMQLYRREKVNPAAGCLPILLQIPVFFALYKVLYTTIEMRHQPFFGWIHDLSAPDPLTIFTGFGLFQWQVPEFLHFFNIGLWPLFMGVTMFLQQKLNPAPTDPVQARLQALEDEIATLQAQISSLKESTSAGLRDVRATADAQPQASVANGRPSIASADGRFTANLHAVMQFDAADYKQTEPGPVSIDFRRGAAAGDTAHARDLSSGTNFRRARFGLDGKTFGDFEYSVLLELGGAGEEDAGHVQELWFQYSGLKPFHFKVGAFPPSIGLDDQASTNGAPFLERAASADIARSLAGGDFREAAMLWASGDRWYAAGSVTGRTVGVVNSQATGVSQPYDSQLGLIGRIAFLPIKTDTTIVHLGVHGSYVARPADVNGPDVVGTAARYTITLQERPELRVDGTRLVSTGAIDARHADTIGLEAAAQYKNFLVQGEYEHYDIERRNPVAGATDPSFHGFNVVGSWLLTGEARRYNTSTFAFDAPAVNHPFSLKNHALGAVELAARYSDIDLNYHAGTAGAAPSVDAVRGGDQRIVTAGLNWYFNPVVRLMFDYQDVRISRLSPSATTFLTPAGAQVGQNYHVLSVRSQFAF